VSFPQHTAVEHSRVADFGDWRPCWARWFARFSRSASLFSLSAITLGPARASIPRDRRPLDLKAKTGVPHAGFGGIVKRYHMKDT